MATFSYPGKKSLLRGIILTAVGIAAIISTFINPNHALMNFGIIALGAGIAFLVYWKLTAVDRERERVLYEEYLSKELASSKIKMGGAPSEEYPRQSDQQAI